MGSNEEVRNLARTSAPHIKVAGVLWAVASSLVMVAAIVWIVLAVGANDYYSNTKTVRDAAEVGSTVLSDLGTIEAVKDWVLPLAFVGLATYLLGFGFAFGNILRNVRLRGATMAAVLPAVKQGKIYCATCADITDPHEH